MSCRRGTHVPRSFRRPLSSRLGLPGGFALLGIVAILLSPSAPAASVASSHTIQRFTAPFAPGAPYDHSRLTRTGCGASTSLPAYPAFNLSTGVASWSSAAFVRACGNATGGFAIQYTKSGITNVTFTVPASGVYNFTGHWSANASFTYNLSSGTTATGGSFSAGYRFAPVLCLFVAATGAGGCSSGVPVQARIVPPANATTWTNHTLPIHFDIVELLRHSYLAAGTTYELRAFLLAHVQVDSPSGLPSGSASASMDVAAPQYGAALVAMKIYQ
jgi:hypothetical protein